MIPRYTLETSKHCELETVHKQPLKQQTSGNIVFVNDVIEHLKELRSEYLSDNDCRRRHVVEHLLRELGMTLYG